MAKSATYFDGRFSHRPVDIKSAYVDGHLYHPTETHVVRKDEETSMVVERLETIVIRSDKDDSPRGLRAGVALNGAAQARAQADRRHRLREGTERRAARIGCLRSGLEFDLMQDGTVRYHRQIPP